MSCIVDMGEVLQVRYYLFYPVDSVTALLDQIDGILQDEVDFQFA